MLVQFCVLVDVLCENGDVKGADVIYRVSGRGGGMLRDKCVVM